MDGWEWSSSESYMKKMIRWLKGCTMLQCIGENESLPHKFYTQWAQALWILQNSTLNITLKTFDIAVKCFKINPRINHFDFVFSNNIVHSGQLSDYVKITREWGKVHKDWHCKIYCSKPTKRKMPQSVICPYPAHSSNWTFSRVHLLSE